MHPELKPILDVLERRVLPSTGGAAVTVVSVNAPPVDAAPIPTPTLTVGQAGGTGSTTAGQPTVVFGSGAGQVFGFPLTATASGPSIEPSNEAAVDDLFQGENLDVFGGVGAPVRANGPSVVPPPPSVGRTRVAPQPGTAYDPYAYRPLQPHTVFGASGDSPSSAGVQPAPAPWGPDIPPPPEQPAHHFGAGAAVVPSGMAVVAGRLSN